MTKAQIFGAILAIGLAPRLQAQSTTASTSVPILELTATEVRSTVPLGAIVGVRALSNGKVLVSDGGKFRLVLLDEKMATSKVVLDSAGDGGPSYGRIPTPIIPYLADTTLFVDRVSATLTVIDPSGAIARIAAAPKPADIGVITAFSGGADRNGNLIYRGTMPQNPSAPSQPAMVSSLQTPDSAPIVRANFDARSVDTLARLKVAGNVRAKMDNVGSQAVLTVTINPIINIDDWALLSDGTIAIVRGHDYHVDLLSPTGSITSGPKLPFDWKRLSDQDKQSLLDSTRAASEKEKASTPNAMSLPASSPVARVGVRRGGEMSISRREVDKSEIADYWPPIRYGAAKADLDGNLWILPTTSAQSKAGELIYDVVNNRGLLTHRVRLPVDRSVAGFGRGGVVYLMGRNADKSWYLERAKVVR